MIEEKVLIEKEDGTKSFGLLKYYEHYEFSDGTIIVKFPSGLIGKVILSDVQVFTKWSETRDVDKLSLADRIRIKQEKDKKFSLADWCAEGDSEESKPINEPSRLVDF